MTEQHEYVQNYIDNLPPELRPEIGDRLKNALRIGWKNGWEPEALALTISKGNFAGVNFPPAAALYRLDQLVLSRSGGNAAARSDAGVYSDAHCRIVGCACNHTVCYKGWIDGAVVEQRGKLYDATTFCPICRTEQYEIMRTSSTREEAMVKLQQRSIYNKSSKYSTPTSF